MPMFRKKPIALNCEQYTGPQVVLAGDALPPIPEGVTWMLGFGDYRYYPVISTLEGEMRVSPGDWVITGVKGEKYPCKDSIFRETYDPVSG